MRLFDDIAPIPIIESDGLAIYYPSVIDEQECKSYMEKLSKEIKWKQDEVEMFGKTIITDRKVAWYASEPFEYTYSKKTKTATIFTPLLLAIKEMVESATNETYNSCLLNLYHNGNEGMGWHTDNEKELVKHSSIASLSMGAERRFIFKHRESKKKVELLLQNGSLLDMKREIQDYWLHSLPKTKKINSPRINLTFRKYQIK